MNRIAMLMLAGTAASALAIEGTEIVVNQGITSGDVDGFTMSPDGQTIYFVGSVTGISGDQLFKLSIDGGDAILLSDPSLHDDVDEGPVVGTDFVYFKGDQGIGNSDNEWFRVSVNGGPQLKITNVTGIAGDGQLINNGQTLVFLNEEPQDHVFSVQTDGSLTTTLLTPNNTFNGSPSSDVDVDQFGWDITSDEQTLVYAIQNNGGSVVNFATVATDGSSTTENLITLVGIPTGFNIVDMVLLNDTTVVFTAEAFGDTDESLFKADLTTGILTTLFDVSATPFGTDIDGIAVSADGTKIAFSGDLTVDGEDHLYVMNADGTGLVNLTPDLADFADVQGGYGDIAFINKGRELVFIADQQADGVNQLYRVFVPAPTAAGVFGLAGLVATRRRR